MNAIPPKLAVEPGVRVEPTVSPVGRVTSEKLAAVTADIAELRAAAKDIEDALVYEGIPERGSLAVWGKAQVRSIQAMVTVVEVLVMRIDQRVEAFAATWKSEALAAETRTRETRAAIVYMREKADNLKAQNEANNRELASKLAADIRDSLIDVMHTREIRFNRRTNWGIIGTAASILVACFIAGNLWNEHRDSVTTIRRCEKTGLVVDAQKSQYCRMDVVRGSE